MKSFVSRIVVLLACSAAALPAAEATFDPALIGSSYVLPLQLKDWPLKIGPEAQLFVDDYLVASMTGVTRIPHQPKKFEGNPVVTGRRANGTIVHDPDAGKYRMYYEEDGRVCVAYSTDGIEWTKPSLGIVSVNGSTANNVVIGDAQPTNLASFIRDPRDPDPKRRWKAAVFCYDHGDNPRREFPGGLYGERSGLYAFFSADGLHWKDDGVMIIPGRRGKLAGSTWPLTGVDDVSIVTWDGQMKKFVAWLKIWGIKDDGYFRSRAMALSDDFIHWSPPWTVLLPDRLDPPGLQIYGMSGWPYASMWIGIIRTFHSGTSQQVDLQLVTSHDGIHWERALNRAAFIPNGPDGSYDHGYHNDFSSAPLRFGDELYFYYGSTAQGKAALRAATNVKTGICLARLRVDGFASLHAAKAGETGGLVTRPLDFSGRELVINAAAAPESGIRVEVLAEDPNGEARPIPGFTLGDCTPVEGDAIAQQVVWKEHRDLSALAGRRIRLRFELKELAGLYSFTIR